MDRKYYIDNIRWVTVLLVILYHVVYIFNSAGVISNFNVQGVKQMDAILYFLYPWFMCLLFVIAGMSARYSLKWRGNVKFLKNRMRRLLAPSIGGILLLGWIAGWVTDQYYEIFAGNAANISGFEKYLILCFCGMGPLWFAHELFIASIVLVLIRCVDKKDKIWELCGRIKFPVIILLVFVVWGSSMILNTPVVEVYRNGIYILMFLMGYYIFSHEEITNQLEKWSVPLIFIAVTIGVFYVMYYFGQNYTTKECLQSFLTNAYAWVMILAMLGVFKKYFNFENAFTMFMSNRTFGFYVLHYPLICIVANSTINHYNFPMLANYFVIFAVVILLLPIFYAIVYRIPVIRYWLLGVMKFKTQKEKVK